MATYSHFVVIAGILGLAHAAFSAAQRNFMIKLFSLHITPKDVIIRLFCSHSLHAY
ncbi:hypothetical protein HOLleu_27982 [Holothuria leucospilota]|uniref:Uncharacterized protein n=1 Tax=Holothuria leucospilota TaxID=206669 RepID=A0A9Q1BR52_HOLLE|nr:hypothetical protein HOLleu_27982 [Holothuria leucospilota]